ncbi:MAG TPA: hypothetical protein VG798_00360 [Rhizomicrobium sp.]|nr:hypothetical protein [Rhizomicrobium sp.]
MRRGLIVVGLLSPLIAGKAGAADQAVSVFYSDFCYHEESGDVLGIRIGILNLSDATYVFYQEAEGAPGVPQLFKLKLGAMAGPKFTLRVDENRVLQGTVTDSAIDAHFNGGYVSSRGEKNLHLERVSDVRKGFRDCK